MQIRPKSNVPKLKLNSQSTEGMLLPKPVTAQPTSPALTGAMLCGVPVAPVLRSNMLCATFGINVSTLWRWIQNRSFPKPLAIGSKVRLWRTTEVNAWLEAQDQASREEV